MKKKNKIIMICMILLVALVGLVATTVAWLTSTNTQTHTFKMGNVEYAFESEGVANDKTVVPGEDIFKNISIKLTNKSTVDSQLRIKVTFNGPLEYSDSSIFKMTFDSNWTHDMTNGDYWYYNGNDGISDHTGLTGIIKKVDGPSEPITVPIHLIFDGSIVGSDYAGKEYTITITFEAKQAEYVQWSEMKEINFKTGLK